MNLFVMTTKRTFYSALISAFVFGSKSIKWADGPRSFVSDNVRVNLSRSDIAVPQNILNGADVTPRSKKLSCKGVPEGMCGHTLLDPAGKHGLSKLLGKGRMV